MKLNKYFILASLYILFGSVLEKTAVYADTDPRSCRNLEFTQITKEHRIPPLSAVSCGNSDTNVSPASIPDPTAVPTNPGGIGGQNTSDPDPTITPFNEPDPAVTPEQNVTNITNNYYLQSTQETDPTSEIGGVYAIPQGPPRTGMGSTYLLSKSVKI